jgi:hypothetical protein
MEKTFRLLKGNNKFFEYKGKPVVLMCATEHYGAVMNRPFDYASYLDYCGQNGQNYTRLFLLFRELQTPMNPYSTCKPESPDYISPFARTKEGKAGDGLGKYDLDKWNNEFFMRLHSFMKKAKENDVIVEVTLFSNSYTNELFSLLPMAPQSNINGVGPDNFQLYMTKKDEELFKYQKKYVKKIVNELNKYPNFFFEICNEPVCFNPELTTPDEVNKWQQSLIDYIRELESTLPIQHLIAVTECWKSFPGDELYVGTDYSFNGLDADIVNVHPLPNIRYKNKRYDMGMFMSKQLCLEVLRDYCLDTWHEKKPLNIDEDNIASQFKDYEAWTIHRKRAWTAVFSGAHYDYIDFSIINYCPKGTEESRRYLHKWFKYLSEYIMTMKLEGGMPLRDFLDELPDEIIPSVYGMPGRQYDIYLADGRELNEEGYGDMVNCSFIPDLEPGEYAITYYSPENCREIKVETRILGNTPLVVPNFKHDIVVRIEIKS